MEIGLCTSCYGDRSWKEVCGTVNRLGINSVEIGSGGYLGKKHCNPATLLENKDVLNSFKNSADKYGIKISALSCHGNPLHPDKKIAYEHTTDLELSIELATKLGVKIINCFSGCPGVAEDAIYPNWISYNFPPNSIDYLKWQWQEKVIPFWSQMVKKAIKCGVKFGFELMVPNVVYNTETFLKLRNEVDAEEIGLSFDPAHLLWQGMDPLVCIRKLGNKIVTVHAIDCKINESAAFLNGVNDYKNSNDIVNRSWNYRIVGYGHEEIFWKDFISTLYSVGFNGPISIEYNDNFISLDEGIKKSIDFLNKIIFYEKLK